MTLTSSISSNSHEASGSLLHGLLGPCLRSAVFVALVTGAAYPLLTTGVAQWLLPESASGSLIHKEGQIIGSRLIGQQFSTAHYFHPRPSATTGPQANGSTGSLPYNAAASLGSNQGPTNAALIESVQQRAQDYRARHGLTDTTKLPVDALTASASGLDPHISLANAHLQAARIARARQLPLSQVEALIEQHTDGRWLGVFGEPRVHVLQLNLSLDELTPVQSTAVHGAASIAASIQTQTSHQASSPIQVEGDHHVQ